MMIYALLILGIILEICSCFWGIRTQSFANLLEIHLLAVFVFALAVIRIDAVVRKNDVLRPVYWYSFLLFIFFGCLGLIADIFIILAVWQNKRLSGSKSILYEEYEEYIMFQKEPGFKTAIHGDLLRRMRSSISFEPYVDVIRGNDIMLKERVIEKLSKIITRASVQLLKDGAKDPIAEVRFML